MLNKLRMFVVSVLLVGSGAALGSNVEWNRLHSNYLQDVGDGNVFLIIGSSLLSSSFDVSILVSASPDGWQPTQGYPYSVTTLALRAMALGETVSYETMLSDGLEYFCKAEWGGPTLSDYSVALTDDDVYMGMAVEAYDSNSNPYVVYGWMKFDPLYDGDINCAWDIDGGAMVVGGGAIPEPSSGVLMAIGLAMLGVRRKKVSP